MQYTELRRRLAVIPEQLPSAPRVLVPTLLAGLGEVPFRSPDRALDPLRVGAVLVLLYPGPAGEAHVLLTVRTAGDFRHAGEVSFPGGAREPTDRSAADAAFREAYEEVGLDRAAAGARVVGHLGSVEIRVSGFRLTPVVALAERLPAVAPDGREVERILEVPLARFLPGAPIELVEEERSGRRLRFGAYVCAGHRIWGATARVLGQLGAVVGSVDGDR